MALVPYSRRKHSSLRQYIVVLVVILFVLAAALLVRLLYQEVVHHTTATKDYLFDPMAISVESIDEEDNIPDGSFLYQINMQMNYDPKDGVVDLMAANPAENPYYLKVILYSQEGETLLETGLLKPGSQLKSAQLSQSLPEGDYSVTVQFQAFEIATLEILGTSECQAQIRAS